MHLTSNDTLEFTPWSASRFCPSSGRVVEEVKRVKVFNFLQSCSYLMIIMYTNPLAGPDAHVASRIVFFKGVSSAGIFVINLKIWMA